MYKKEKNSKNLIALDQIKNLIWCKIIINMTILANHKFLGRVK